jgi:hypothetical protein
MMSGTNGCMARGGHGLPYALPLPSLEIKSVKLSLTYRVFQLKCTLKKRNNYLTNGQNKVSKVSSERSIVNFFCVKISAL